MERRLGAWGAMVAALDAMTANLTLHLRLTSQTARANANGVDPRRTSPGARPVAGELRELARDVDALAAHAAGNEVDPIRDGY